MKFNSMMFYVPWVRTGLTVVCSIQTALILRDVHCKVCTNLHYTMFSSQLKHQETEKRKHWQRMAQIPLSGTVTKYPPCISIGKPVYSQSPFIMSDSLQRIILCTHHLLQETYYFGSELLVWLRDGSNGFTSFVLQFETVEHKTGREKTKPRGITTEGNAQMQTRWQTDKGKGEMMQKYTSKEDRGRRRRKWNLYRGREKVGRKLIDLWK